MPKRNRLQTRTSKPTVQELPPLILVRAFEAVGRTGSMRLAAEDIHVSHTVVSRHVRNLEAWMGVKLVSAGPRGATLTPEGARFHQSVSKGLQMIARSVLELRPLPKRRSLRVWCMPGLATRWLAPRLSTMGELLPGVEIVLRAIDRLPDFRHHEADLMIAFGNPEAAGTEAVALVQPRMFPVAAPKWISRNRVPESLAALSRAELIHEESHEQWKAWFTASGASLDHPLAGPRLWDANLGLDAAIACQGIALASRLTAGDEIDAGRLVQLFGSNVRLGSYFLIIAPDRRGDPLVRRFEAWLRDSMREYDGA